MNILIIKLSAIGDVIHTLPSLAALRRFYPKAHITWVIEEAASDLITRHPYVDRVIISQRKRLINDLKKGRIVSTAKETASFVGDIRKRRYDLVIDFHGLLKSAVIVLLSGGKRKLGYESLQEGSGLFYNEKIPEDMKKHAVDRYLDFVRHLGATVENPEFLIQIGKENESRIKELLESGGIDYGAPFVALSPQALWKTKLWSDQKFAQLAERIMRELDLPVVLTGAGKEATEGIQRFISLPCLDLSGQTTLRDLACLYRQAALIITTDSGPMHLAAAVGTSVVALFGPTAPSRTGPYGKGHRVIRRELPCSPCFLKKCDTLTCMKDITVDDVYQVVTEKLGKDLKNG